MTKQFHFYKITNTINGKSYVGYTGQYHATARWKQHLAAAKRGESQVLYDAIRKHDAKNFIFDVLSTLELTPEQAIQKETAYIYEHKTLVGENGYNIKAVDGVYSESVKQSKSERMKAYYASGGTHPMKGKVHSTEAIQKMSTSHLQMSEDTKEKIGEASKKMWQDPASRQKILTHVQNPSPTTRQKMSKAKRGKPSWNKGKPNTWTALHRSRIYVVTTPDGKEITVTNLRAFAVKNGLSQGTLHMTATGARAAHKGYRARFL
jgi:group I intron endonuclease